MTILDTAEMEAISTALSARGLPLADDARAFFAALGYESGKTMPGSFSAAEFLAKLKLPPQLKDGINETAFRDYAEKAAVVFQFGDDEINAANKGGALFPGKFRRTDIQSFVFIAIDLKARPGGYGRVLLARMTRAINRRLAMPAVVFFRHNDDKGGKSDDAITLSFVHRRAYKKDKNRDTIGRRVSMLRAISRDNPHRGHQEILADLTRKRRMEWMDKKGETPNFENLLAAWLDALDIEELNRNFYKQLFAWFELALKKAKFPDDERVVLPPAEHVIRLITRLMFSWFAKEKRLVNGDLFEEAKVRPLLKTFGNGGDSYYRAVLQNLFFATLNTEGERGFSQGSQTTHRDFSRYRYKAQMHNPEALLDMLKQSPFVNGGLFDCLDSWDAIKEGGYRVDCFSDVHYGKVSIPDSLFFGDSGIIPLLNNYKFTVEENTPIEQEVALDPELLGRVFENLLAANVNESKESARKATGSYYTPRQVVDFMVDECLIAALATKCETGETIPNIRKRLCALLNYGDDYEDDESRFDNGEAERIVRAIAGIKVLDPAVGSGAFPMGVLHKLTLALSRLDPKNNHWQKIQIERAQNRASDTFNKQSDKKERAQKLNEINEFFEHYRDSDYGRKLYLIQNSIFGVDIQPVACQIAKLRFFISLAIEQQANDNPGENFGIKPLPNLETRFIAADTLIAMKSPDISSQKAQRLEREIYQNLEQHFHATTRNAKRGCQKEDSKLRAQLATELKSTGMPSADAERIAQWNVLDQNARAAGWFDAERMFGIKDKFDIVIGNPPYVKVEHLPQNRRDHLKSEFNWLGDLYEHFIYRGLDFVAQGGVFSYIANDSFVGFSTKTRIRERFLQNQLSHLVRAPGQTFDAHIYAAIFILSRKEPDLSHSYVSGEMILPDFDYQKQGSVKYATIRKLPNKRLLFGNENPLLVRLLPFDKMDKWLHILDAGIHSGNVRTKIFFPSTKTPYRLLQGKQIGRYWLNWDSPKAKYRFCDIYYECQPVPGIGRSGKQSKKAEWWRIADIENHHKPERLLLRQTDDDLVAAYHSEAEAGRFYTDNTLFTILPKIQGANLKYFLALLNSRLINFVYHSLAQEKGKVHAQVKTGTVKALPAVLPEQDRQNPIIALTDKILAAKAENPAANTSQEEAEIDQLVYALYGLNDDEIAIVEGRAP